LHVQERIAQAQIKQLSLPLGEAAGRPGIWLLQGDRRSTDILRWGVNTLAFLDGIIRPRSNDRAVGVRQGPDPLIACTGNIQHPFECTAFSCETVLSMLDRRLDWLLLTQQRALEQNELA